MLVAQAGSGLLVEAIRVAAATVADPLHFSYIIVATLLGLVIGVIPGLGGPIALALLIPITLEFESNIAIMIMVATLGGTTFGGSITAILINTPGDAPNAATLIDGYPLARQGKSGAAITASAVASATGALIGVGLFLVLVPAVQPLILTFRSPEFFWLAVFGLIAIAFAVEGPALKNLIGGGIGLMLAFHGLNPITGGTRFTWDTLYLLDGIPLIPAVIGLLAVAEMVRLMGGGTSIAEEIAIEGGRREGIRAVLNNPITVLRASATGWIVGIIPGVGGSVANFIAYFQEKQVTGDAGTFGEGDIRGVIASESSNDASDGGSLLPTLALGIPGSASMAILLGAFVAFGIVPGPIVFRENLDLVFVIVFSLAISNVVTSAAGVLTANYLRKITRIDVTVLAPIILVVAMIGAYALRNSIEDVFVALLFGVIGFWMMKVGVSRIIVVIALILGPIAEVNFHQSLQATSGNYTALFTRPKSIVLVLIIVAFMLYPLFRTALDEVR
jgi:putative tricarboxylic transport membrane protein